MALAPDFGTRPRRRSSALTEAVVAYRNPAGSLGRSSGSGRINTSLAGTSASGAGASGRNPGLTAASGAVSASPSSPPDFQTLLAHVQELRAQRAAPSSTSSGAASPTVVPSAHDPAVTYEIHGPVSARVKAAIQLAESYVGTPYVWGGSKPGGFDCSGLLFYAYGKEGISIGRTTYEQLKHGRSVSTSALRPGDAVFFHGGSHVAMYIGGGRMLESPHTGAKVRIVPLRSGIYAARRFSR